MADELQNNKDVFNLSNINESLELNISFSPSDLSSLSDLSEFPRSENGNSKRHDIVDKILYHYIRHNVTFTCLEDTCKLMAAARTSSIEFPLTKYSLMKTMEERASITLKRTYFVECSKCNIYSTASATKHEVQCNKCKQLLIADETNFFIYIPIENQIIQSLKLNWSQVERFNEKDSHSDTISDVHNAYFLQDLHELFSKSETNILSLMLNTDGANKFKSNSHSVWPIQLVQNYLPPELRYKPSNILTACLYYGKEKPDCIKYFQPLISELNELKAKGLSLNVENETYRFFPIVTHCVVDLPAKHMLQRIKQYNGRNACTYCMHPGQTVQITKKLKVIRYTYDQYPLRDHVRTVTSMDKKKNDSNSDGVIGKSCLVSLPNFNIINGFGIDYMHCVLLGVVRKLLNLFLNSKHHKRCFYLDKKKMAILQRKLLSIKPIREIIRKPRPLKDLSNYKANELRSILLYYFPVCLIGILPPKYVTNFQQLSFAIYILLKSNINCQDLIDAKELLELFVHDFQLLYGKFNMVMNVHLLTHIVESVRFLGPLWAQSAFGFERNNGCLLKFVNGTKDVLDQMSSKYLIKKYLEIKSTPVDECKTCFIGKPKLVKEMSLTLFDDVTDISLEIVNKEFFAYKALTRNGIRYTSLLQKKTKKSIDYFVGLKSGTFGVAKYYIHYKDNKYVVLEEYEEFEKIGHISEVEPSSLTIYAPVDCISKKFIYMEVNKKKYISCMPNDFENE